MIPPLAWCGGNQEDSTQKRKQAMVHKLKIEIGRLTLASKREYRSLET